jgi:hypothetical protein
MVKLSGTTRLTDEYRHAQFQTTTVHTHSHACDRLPTTSLALPAASIAYWPLQDSALGRLGSKLGQRLR